MGRVLVSVTSFASAHFRGAVFFVSGGGQYWERSRRECLFAVFYLYLYVYLYIYVLYLSEMYMYIMLCTPTVCTYITSLIAELWFSQQRWWWRWQSDQKMKKPPNLCYRFISTLPENTSVYLTDVPINVQANYIMSPIQNLTRNRLVFPWQSMTKWWQTFIYLSHIHQLFPGRYPSVKCEAPTGVFSNLDLGLLDFGASYTFILKKVCVLYEYSPALQHDNIWSIP